MHSHFRGDTDQIIQFLERTYLINRKRPLILGRWTAWRYAAFRSRGDPSRPKETTSALPVFVCFSFTPFSKCSTGMVSIKMCFTIWASLLFSSALGLAVLRIKLHDIRLSCFYRFCCLKNMDHELPQSSSDSILRTLMVSQQSLSNTL